MTSSLPPAESFDSCGPKVGLVICGLRWQTPHDCDTSCWPSCCCSLSAAGWAEAICGNDVSNKNARHALHFIPGSSRLAAFAQPTPRWRCGKGRDECDGERGSSVRRLARCSCTLSTVRSCCVAT